MGITHTPGPWTARCRDVSYKDGEWPVERFLQWEVYGPDTPNGRGQFHQADAYLVAAAPDLLEALVYYRDECSGHEPSLSVFRRMLDEAVARATGGKAVIVDNTNAQQVGTDDLVKRTVVLVNWLMMRYGDDYTLDEYGKPVFTVQPATGDVITVKRFDPKAPPQAVEEQWVQE